MLSVSYEPRALCEANSLGGAVSAHGGILEGVPNLQVWALIP